MIIVKCCTMPLSVWSPGAGGLDPSGSWRPCSQMPETNGTTSSSFSLSLPPSSIHDANMLTHIYMERISGCTWRGEDVWICPPRECTSFTTTPNVFSLLEQHQRIERA
ncbi:hypothetical protein E2320_011647, partial [Naja naja]